MKKLLLILIATLISIACTKNEIISKEGVVSIEVYKQTSWDSLCWKIADKKELNTILDQLNDGKNNPFLLLQHKYKLKVFYADTMTTVFVVNNCFSCPNGIYKTPHNLSETIEATAKK